MKERHLEKRSRCCEGTLKGNIYDLVPGSLSMKEGQRKQEKESRARHELEFTRDASVTSQYLCFVNENNSENYGALMA